MEKIKNEVFNTIFKFSSKAIILPLKFTEPWKGLRNCKSAKREFASKTTEGIPNDSSQVPE